MGRKSTSTANTNNFVRKYKKRIAIAVICILLIALGAWWLVARIDAAGAAGRSYQRLQAIDGWFTPPGELVYNQIRDNGCGTDTSSWLGNNKVCGHTLIKIYKGKGSAETSLRAANDLIIGEGWQKPENKSPFKDEVQDSYEEFITHRWTGGSIISTQGSPNHA